MEDCVDKLLKVSKLASQIILENGGETYRAEETINFICKSAGVKEIDSVATPTGIHITLSTDENKYNTVVKRINKRTINLSKLYEVNNISRQLTSRNITVDEAISKLQEVRNHTENEHKYIPLFYGGMSAAFFTLVFGGGIFEFFISLLSGVIVSIVSKKFENIHSYHLFISILSGIIIAFIAISSTYISKMGNYNYIIVGGMIPQLPGLSMTNAIRDTMRGDLLSGITRAAEAILIASCLALGTGLIFTTAYYFGFLTI